MTWKIDETAAGTTVMSAHNSAIMYDLDAEHIRISTQSLLGSLTHSSFVSAAVDAWVLSCGQLGFDAVRGSTNTAIEATSQAITHYHDGQLTMASNAQSLAGLAEYPEELPKADGSANPVPER